MGGFDPRGSTHHGGVQWALLWCELMSPTSWINSCFVIFLVNLSGRLKCDIARSLPSGLAVFKTTVLAAH